MYRSGILSLYYLCGLIFYISKYKYVKESGKQEVLSFQVNSSCNHFEVHQILINKIKHPVS